MADRSSQIDLSLRRDDKKEKRKGDKKVGEAIEKE
jgi:hypothetical protein